MNQKAQASLEYLLTYGWALIMVATVVGTLVFVVGTPSGSTAFSSSDPGKILIKGGSISGTGNVDVMMQNLTGMEITITDIVLTGSFHESPVTLNGVDIDKIQDGSTPVKVSAGSNIYITGISYTGSGAGGIEMDYTEQTGLERNVSIIGGATDSGLTPPPPPVPIGTEDNPGLSCKDILDQGGSTGDGTYWIDPTGTDKFTVYCDMTTDGGGWTEIAYALDLTHGQHPLGDQRNWLPSNFTTVLTTDQILAIQAVSLEGKQTYDGSCEGVVHWLWSGAYEYAFRFRFLDGYETPEGTNVDSGTDLLGVDYTLVQDECNAANPTKVYSHTIWDFRTKRVPIINVSSRDNGNGELFGSALTSNPAWLR